MMLSPFQCVANYYHSLLKGSPEDLSSRGFLLLCHTAVLRASASVNKL